MDIGFFPKGLIIGFSIAAPVGPIGVMCIRRTLADGMISGFLSGLGAATADAAYGMIAGFGLTIISNFLIGQQAWLRLFGGMFLCYLGIRTFLMRPAQKPALPNHHQGLFGNYFSTFILTLTNPMTILSFAAVFAGLGLGMDNASNMSSLILVSGVFLGSASWWLFLSLIVSLFRKRFNTTGLLWVNRVSGLVIIVFGLIALISLA